MRVHRIPKTETETEARVGSLATIDQQIAGCLAVHYGLLFCVTKAPAYLMQTNASVLRMPRSVFPYKTAASKTQERHALYSRLTTCSTLVFASDYSGMRSNPTPKIATLIVAIEPRTNTHNTLPGGHSGSFSRRLPAELLPVSTFRMSTSRSSNLHVVVMSSLW